MSDKTISAEVGLGRPERFALGAATGIPQASKNACAMGCAGTLIHIVDQPARTSAQICASLSSTSVRGQGIHFLIKICSNGCLMRAYFEICTFWETCTIKGLSLGLVLAENIFFTALLFVASAPNPYTVSVGKAIISPFWRWWASSLILCGKGEISCVYTINAI